MYATIRSGRDDHRRYCSQPRFEIHEWGREGDVRRCEHGKIMLAVQVPGTIPPYWVELSPVFNPIRYRRALRALATPARAGREMHEEET